MTIFIQHILIITIAKRVFKAYKKALANFSESNKGFNAYKGDKGGEVRYSLPIGNEIVDARSVTEQDVRTLLDNAFNKQYRDGSYIPVRVNTPSILIEAAQRLGKTIDNLPIILNVGKARQMMSSQREWALEQKRGTAHNFTVDDIISLIKAMDKPKQIIFQSTDERFVEVVEFDTAEKQKAVVVLEIGESKKSEYLNDESGFYQILVTAFEPDTGYVETLVNKDGNIRIYPKKKKGASQSGSGNRVPSHLNESPFAISISNPAEKINPSDENYSKNLPTDIRRQSVSKVGGDTDQASKRTFSYNELVAKGNLTGVVVDKSQQVKIKTAPDGTVKIDDAYIQSEVRKQCKSIKTNAENPTYYVEVPDIARNVEITSKAIKHGYHKSLKAGLNSISNRDSLNARISLELPEILQNSIEVNISNRTDNSDVLYSHIMMGTVGIEIAQRNIEYYAVRSVIEERTNQNPILAEYEIIGKLHALNAKKISSATVSGTKKWSCRRCIPSLQI